MNKGGGIGSMVKGKISKVDNYFKDKTVKAGNKISNISNKIGDKVSDLNEGAKILESNTKDSVNLSEKKDILTNKFSEGIKKIKSFDDNISKKQAKGRMSEEILKGKSVVNKYGLFGPDTYKYLIYVILFLNICCITLLLFNETTFYKYQNSAQRYI